MKNLELLKTPADFNELLDLQSLSTQMLVLSHLNNNLIGYQREFLKSFIKTPKEIIDYIAEKDIIEYIENVIYDDWDFSVETDKQKLSKFKKFKSKYIIDIENKNLFEISAANINKFKFSLDKNGVLLKCILTSQEESYSQTFGGGSSIYTAINDEEYVFDMKTNTFKSYKEKLISSNSIDSGYYDYTGRKSKEYRDKKKYI
jgi:hypothetical protein